MATPSPGFPRVLWPYAEGTITVGLSPEEVLARIRGFIAYESRTWAALHYSEAKGRFAGRVRGSRFRMTRVVLAEYPPYILGRVREGTGGGALVELRFTVGGLYVLPVVAIVAAVYSLVAGDAEGSILVVGLLAWFGVVVARFWSEVRVITEELRRALGVGAKETRGRVPADADVNTK